MEIKVKTIDNEYSVYVGYNLLDKCEEYISFPNKTLILTDDNIPEEYVNKLADKAKNACICTVKNGEESKSFETYQEVMNALMENEFTRKDLLISLGGGVIGDLGGFVASTYKRGIRFINVPTTTLSMVDSSIGGKNGINFLGYKNMVGSFYQPEMVIADLSTLESLPRRHFYSGLIEALKSGLIGDSELFELFFDDVNDYLEEIIVRSINVKKKVVEIDPYEKGLRKILNYGHTFGHALESYYSLKDLYHGEAVGIGMYLVLKGRLKEKVEDILGMFSVDYNMDFDKEEILKLVTQDKKVSGDTITLVLVEEVGKAKLKEVTFDELRKILYKED